MPTPSFNIGRDATLVFVGPFGQLQMNVTQFRWQDHPHEIMSRPLDSPTAIAFVPDYLSGTFDIDRNNNALETLVASQYTVFYAGGAIPTGTLYAYITEVNGSQTTLTFTGVVVRLNGGGDYKKEDRVTQSLEFMASTITVS